MNSAEIFAKNWLAEINTQEAFDLLGKVTLQEELPIAMWRMPGKMEKHLLVDLSGEATHVHPEVEVLPPGFIFTPYEADLTSDGAREEKQSLLLNADLYFTTAEGSQLQLASGLSPVKVALAEKLIEQAEKYEALGDEPQLFFALSSDYFQPTKKEEYCQLVKDAVKEIEEGRLQKLVCGRSKVLELPENFQPFDYFRRLCDSYANAFVSFVSIPGVGSWIGASPEVLISINQQKIFKTMALAGTQPKSAAQKPADAVWRQKEIEEQALVSRYIINCFKKIRLREFDEHGPRTIVAGNLMHLRTDFIVDMEATDFPQLGSVMLELLHPTSAVCGMPKALAKDFLAQREKLDRQFFAGFLGPVLLPETCLFVNLRCMQLLEKRAIFYAGAGITADSDPEKEWQETEEKIGTLTALLAAEE